MTRGGERGEGRCGVDRVELLCSLYSRLLIGTIGAVPRGTCEHPPLDDTSRSTSRTKGTRPPASANPLRERRRSNGGAELRRWIDTVHQAAVSLVSLDSIPRQIRQDPVEIGQKIRTDVEVRKLYTQSGSQRRASSWSNCVVRLLGTAEPAGLSPAPGPGIPG